MFWRPQVKPYSVDFKVKTVAAGATTNITVKASDGTKITVSGQIAAGTQPVLRTCPVQITTPSAAPR
ncbi:hypothetical protein [Streptomyces griseorubiginosus]|uniref:hypothetical protein n=1 Tax=Streptomyces griseorubiginosus TaxID=67304 RepID=UPI001AD7259C|nr:hypothetical protein [Streptomyces griseorubiginosus]